MHQARDCSRAALISLSPPRAQDTATLLSVANLTERAAHDTRAFYVLQIELDLLVTPARPEASEEEAEGTEGTEGSKSSAAGAAAAAPPRAPRGEAGAPPWRGNLRILGGVNEEAITRVWLARRDGRGAFLSCDAPNGAQLLRCIIACARCAHADACAVRVTGAVGD